jgi:hypothetical protein
MITVNRQGYYFEFPIQFQQIKSMNAVENGRMTATLDGLSLTNVFEKLTADEIVALMPDQSTLKEVRRLLNSNVA